MCLRVLCISLPTKNVERDRLRSMKFVRSMLFLEAIRMSTHRLRPCTLVPFPSPAMSRCDRAFDERPYQVKPSARCGLHRTAGGQMFDAGAALQIGSPSFELWTMTVKSWKVSFYECSSSNFFGVVAQPRSFTRGGILLCLQSIPTDTNDLGEYNF